VAATQDRLLRRTQIALLGGVLLSPPLHPGPPIWGDISIETDRILWEIQGEPEPLQRCLGLSHLPIGELAPGPRELVEQELRTWFTENNPVTVDGKLVPPEILRLELPVDSPDEDGWLTVKIDLLYSLEEAPSRVSFLWESFEGTDWGGESYVPLLIKHAGNTRMSSVWEEEPEYTWHASTAPRPRSSLASPSGQGLISGRRERGPLGNSGLALLLAGGGLSALQLLRSGRRRPTLLLGLLVAVTGTGLLSYDSALGGRIRLPAPEQALSLFESLHRNVYSAFEARSEDEIYDLLAASLDPEILDEQYGEIYESMILREEGGAVCSIESLEVLSRGVALEPRRGELGATFDVDWTWRVHGAVAHWGHIHKRTNHYRAVYTVRHDGVSWKIARVDVKEHSRVEE